MNMYKTKRIITLLLGALFPAIVYELVRTLTNNIITAYIALLVSVLLSFLFSSLMLYNPFTAMIEGKGILTLTWDSTGVITPFLVNVDPPLIKGNFMGRLIKDIFDRKLVNRLSTPIVQNYGVKKENDGTITIKLDHEKYNNSKFQMYDVPVIFYNKNLNTTITKEMLSETESSTIAEHGIMYQNHLIKSLEANVAGFARHTVDVTQKIPGNILKSPFTWIIIIILIVIAGIFVLPKVFPGLMSGLGAITNVVNSTSTVIPK